MSSPSPIMSLDIKRNLKFKDRIDKDKLLTISTIKTLFQKYNHDEIQRYEQSMVFQDVGSLFFLLYIKEKYKHLCHIPIDKKDILPAHNLSLLEWLQEIDYEMSDEDNPKYLIYYQNQKFCYDDKLISKSSLLQIHIVSHIFPKGSGHIGCLFIQSDKAYYYDPNGLKDPDDENYYDTFEKNLSKELSKYEIIYCPYRFKKGIQVSQYNEEPKYGMDIMGMCCSWTFLIIELKLMNPELTIEEIETKLRKKYEFRLTRMIVSYQQEIHCILYDLSKEYYKNIF